MSKYCETGSASATAFGFMKHPLGKRILLGNTLSNKPEQAADLI
jgi:hypothetical protein